MKLRVIRPAPTSRTSATATSTTTSAFSRRRAPGAAVLATDSLKLSRSSPRDACSAGTRPTAIATANRDDGREHEHAAIELDLIHAGEPRLGQRGEKPQSPCGGQPAEDAAANRQQQALGENRPRDLPPSAAERAADGDFPPPARQARQEQIGHVGADDQQQECRRRPSASAAPAATPTRAARAPRPPARSSLRCCRGCRRRCAPPAGRPLLRARPGVALAATRPTTINDRARRERPCRSLGSKASGVQSCALGRGRKLECRRHHADDGVELGIELNRPADDVGLRAEHAPPERIAQDDDARLRRTGRLRAGTSGRASRSRPAPQTAQALRARPRRSSGRRIQRTRSRRGGRRRRLPGSRPLLASLRTSAPRRDPATPSGLTSQRTTIFSGSS